MKRLLRLRALSRFRRRALNDAGFRCFSSEFRSLVRACRADLLIRFRLLSELRHQAPLGIGLLEGIKVALRLVLADDRWLADDFVVLCLNVLWHDSRLHHIWLVHLSPHRLLRIGNNWLRHHWRLAEGRASAAKESGALLRLYEHHVQLDQLLSQVRLLLLWVPERRGRLTHSLVVHLHDGSDLLLDLFAIGLRVVVLVLVLDEVNLIESGGHRYALHHAWVLVLLLAKGEVG